MKNKIILKILSFIMFFILTQLIYSQENCYFKNGKSSNSYIKKIIKKSIKEYNNYYGSHVNKELLYGIYIKELSLKEKTGVLVVGQISNRLDFEKNKSQVGYIKIKNKIVLINSSDSCKEILVNEVKISPINKEISEKLDLIYPNYTELIDQITKWHWGESLFVEIKFIKNKVEVISKMELIE